MSAAERQRKRRKKLRKEGKYEEYKLKHKEETKKYRRKLTEKMKKLPKVEQESIKKKGRAAVRIRVAKHRLKKTESISNRSQETETQSAYQSAQALGKAVSRAKRSLPSTPRRRNVVVRKLFKDNCEENSRNIELPCHGLRHANSLNEEIVLEVKKFYCQDDISRMAPG